MTLHLSLSPESEDKLRQRAKAAGVSPEEFASRLLEEALRSADRDGAAAEPATAGTVADLFGPGDLPPEEAERRLRHLRNWLAMARPSTSGATLDDSRESIYDGCGK